MNNNDYKEALFYAASIFNERLGAEFSLLLLIGGGYFYAGYKKELF